MLAARAVFGRKGLDAPLDEIAREAGVSIGTLYNRFPERGALVDAALAPLAGRAVELAERAARDADPWRAFELLVTGTCELFAQDRGFADFYRSRVPGTPAVTAARQRIGTLKDAVMARAMSAGVLRTDIGQADVVFLTWGTAAVMDATRGSAPDAWRRHLALHLDALRPAAAHPLPGPPPSLAGPQDARPANAPTSR